MRAKCLRQRLAFTIWAKISLEKFGEVFYGFFIFIEGKSIASEKREDLFGLLIGPLKKRVYGFFHRSMLVTVVFTTLF